LEAKSGNGAPNIFRFLFAILLCSAENSPGARETP
jgi:hypothetical protein